MWVLKNARLPLKKVSPIQAIPNMLTMAFMPAANTLPCTAFFTSALLTMRMSAAVDIMMISMVSGMPMRVVVPSTVKEGRSEGTEPNKTTRNTPRRKAKTEYWARLSGCSSICWSSSASFSGLMNPSFTLRRYSGSFSRSLPMKFCTNDATRMAMSDAGMQMRRMSFSSMPRPPSRSVLMTAAVAAETGLPVMPSEAAIAATLIGRSGRILLLVAISEMMGSKE